MNRIFLCVLLMLVFSAGCSTNQTVKNTWKSTKGFWYTYVNKPVSIDYDDKGEIPEYEEKLAKAMMGIDKQLLALERTMQNADRAPTPEWLNDFSTRFPWVNGLVGLDAKGSIVGQAGAERSDLDFTPLLENDPKQNIRSLRAHVQETAQGPEVMLAVPLYDGLDFLGVVAVHFDIDSLARFSDDPQSIIICSPAGTLWAGSFGSMPGDWDRITRQNAYGSISDGGNTYVWVTRYLGNYPLVFGTLKTVSKSSKDEAAPAPSEESPASAENKTEENLVSAENKSEAEAQEAEASPAASDMDLELPELPKL